jgi:hypothetical protein
MSDHVPEGRTLPGAVPGPQRVTRPAQATLSTGAG